MLHSPFLTSVARENRRARAWILQVGKLCVRLLGSVALCPVATAPPPADEDLLAFFREGGDGVNGGLLRYL